MKDVPDATERKKKNPYTGRILGETIIEEADKVHARGDTIYIETTVESTVLDCRIVAACVRTRVLI